MTVGLQWCLCFSSSYCKNYVSSGLLSENYIENYEMGVNVDKLKSLCILRNIIYYIIPNSITNKNMKKHLWIF